MRLRRDGWIGRAYFWSLRSTPYGDERTRMTAYLMEKGEARATLCDVMTSLLVRVPMLSMFYLMLCAAGLVVCVFAGIVVLLHLPTVLYGVAGLGALAVIGLIGIALSRVASRVLHIEITEVLAAGSETVRAVKRRYCPIVEWVRPDRVAGGE